MTILDYNQFTAGGYAGQISRAFSHVNRNFLAPLLFQVQTVTFTTGDATPGWSVLTTNSATGENFTLTFDPVDAAGAPSATTADAAATLHRVWNSNPTALRFARATLSGSVVTLTFNTIEAYTVVTTEAGAGVAVDALVSAGGGIKAYIGRWQFFDSTAAVAAGDSPLIISASAQTALLNIAGVAIRAPYMEQPTDDLNDHWRLGADVACMRQGQIRVRTTQAVTPATTPRIITAAGVDLGLTNGTAGLDISAFARFSHSAAANELVEVWYDLQAARP